MRKIRVNEGVKICFKHPYVGRIEIPVDRIEQAADGEGYVTTVVSFSKKTEPYHEDIPMTLNISRAMRLIARHVEEWNAQAEQHAKERGFTERLDRYVVKDMCLEEIWFVDGGIQLHCTWEDCYGARRGYSGNICKIHSAYNDENSLHAYYKNPTFYF